ncbi:MAG: RSP_7527 family protein [Pseudomonadota bacterium]
MARRKAALSRSGVAGAAQEALMSRVSDDVLPCPRQMTPQQWSDYKARIVREAHELRAAAIRRAFSGLLAILARPFASSSPILHKQKLEHR